MFVCCFTLFCCYCIPLAPGASLIQPSRAFLCLPRKCEGRGEEGASKRCKDNRAEGSGVLWGRGGTGGSCLLAYLPSTPLVFPDIRTLLASSAPARALTARTAYSILRRGPREISLPEVTSLTRPPFPFVSRLLFFFVFLFFLVLGALNASDVLVSFCFVLVFSSRPIIRYTLGLVFCFRFCFVVVGRLVRLSRDVCFPDWGCCRGF